VADLRLQLHHLPRESVALGKACGGELPLLAQLLIRSPAELVEPRLTIRRAARRSLIYEQLELVDSRLELRAEPRALDTGRPRGEGAY
jgi:hypothetical protein